MKKFSKILGLLVVVLLTFSCVKQQTFINLPWGWTEQAEKAAEGQIIFGSYTPATKATVDGQGISVGPNQVGYDSFQIYGFKDGEAVMDPYQVSWMNSVWSYEGIGSQQIQYFDRDAQTYEFVGYISDKVASRVNSTVTVPDVEAFLASDEKDTPKEFLYTQKTLGKAEMGQVVNLEFVHGNARMFIGFASDRTDTEILDYTPYNPGTPAQDAWDETVEVTTYQTVAKPTPMLGPAIGTITDEDIDYINSKYTSSLGWLSYYGSSSTFTGPLDENMWEYLVSKHPELASEDLGNWGTYTNNSNMRLVHVAKDGKRSTDGDSYRGWFVNVQNVNWEGTTVTTTIHHDAVPAVPASGLEGIRVFSVDDSSTPIVRKAHTVKADAVLTSTSFAFNNVTTADEVITFEKPSGPVAYAADAASVTLSNNTLAKNIWYALPVSNTGFVVKFSYRYNGVEYYDARVLIPTAASNFQQSQDYTYTIYITSETNGSTDPNQANDEKDEVDTTQKAITFEVVSFGSYYQNNHQVYSIR